MESRAEQRDGFGRAPGLAQCKRSYIHVVRYPDMEPSYDSTERGGASSSMAFGPCTRLGAWIWVKKSR